MAVSEGRPTINSWQWEQNTVRVKRTPPPSLSTIVASPNGLYLFGACSKGYIYAWLISTSAMVASFRAHDKEITVMRVSDDGSCLVSGSSDALIHVWRTSSITAASLSSQPSQSSASVSLVRPTVAFQEHGLPVTDLHIGIGGASGRVASVSVDRTCKLWELGTGQLLASFAFPCGLSSVTMDGSEQTLCAGGDNGSIYVVSLTPRAASAAGHAASYASQADIERTLESAKDVLVGHTGRVTHLVLTVDGSHLTSGSSDSSVVVWDVPTRTALRSFTAHKGPISALLPVPFHRSPSSLALSPFPVTLDTVLDPESAAAKPLPTIHLSNFVQ